MTGLATVYRGTVTARLASEQVETSSLMSFTGSTRTIWSLTRTEKALSWDKWPRVALTTLVVALIAAWWVIVAMWYMVALFFWPLLLISRGFGRSRRRGRVAQLQHREILEALEARDK